MKQIIEWSQGNPGAMQFLIQFLNPKNAVLGLSILPTLEKATTIRGANLYVLWSDLCHKNLSKVETLCLICPIPILEDACSRQDYSGQELVAKYFR